MSDSQQQGRLDDLIRPLETAITKLEEARARHDAESIPGLRTVYAEARKAFHTTLVMNEIDENDPLLADVFAADENLFQTLKQEDTIELSNAMMEGQRLMQERVEAEGPRKSSRGSIPRKLPLMTSVDRIVLGDAANDAYMLHTLYAAERMRETKNPDVILGMMARLIAFALAVQENTDVFDTFVPDDEREVHLRYSLNVCRRLYDRFGDDLCNAATLRGKEGRDEWLNLAKRIGCGYEATRDT